MSTYGDTETYLELQGLHKPTQLYTLHLAMDYYWRQWAAVRDHTESPPSLSARPTQNRDQSASSIIMRYFFPSLLSTKSSVERGYYRLS